MGEISNMLDMQLSDNTVSTWMDESVPQRIKEQKKTEMYHH